MLWVDIYQFSSSRGENASVFGALMEFKLFPNFCYLFIEDALLLLLADLHQQAFVDSQLLEAHVASLRAFLPSGAHRKRAAHETVAAGHIACITCKPSAYALSLSNLYKLSLLDFLPLLLSLPVLHRLPHLISFVLANDHFDVFSIVDQFYLLQFVFFLHLFVQFFLDINISLS